MSDKKNIARLYGLIGYPLSHSFSQKYFNEKFKLESIVGAGYKNFEIEHIGLLPKVLLENPLLKGFSVTIPYKESIIPFLNDIDNNAKEIGAVNAVKCVKTDTRCYLKGYNTDYYGFLESLKNYLSGKEKYALILGNGGAAKAVIQAIKYLGLKYYVVSRKASERTDIISYNAVSRDILNKTDILINTTPLGMWPNIDRAPDILYHELKKGAIAFDLIYNPDITLFMKKSEEAGAITVNGLEMLRLQAEKAWEIFNS